MDPQETVKDKRTNILNAQKERRKKQEKSTRVTDEVNNPCIKESSLSLKCLDDNHYDKDKCQLYFKNYTNCLNFWKRVRRDRKSRGIQPELPLPEDREQVKQDYFAKLL